MNVVNAISKVRFSTATAQRVRLHRAGCAQIELICLEPGQRVDVDSGQWSYYVVTGTAVGSSGGESAQVPTGQCVAFDSDEPHGLANNEERRAVILAMGAGA